MKNNTIEYKGYHSIVEFDAETLTLRGKIEGINDLVTFESKNAENIEIEFHDAVDDYLDFCKEIGKEPDKEYKGSFNVRISPELHKKLAFMASRNEESLNATVEKAIQAYLINNVITNTQLQQTIEILSDALATQSIYNCDTELPYSTASKLVKFPPYNSQKLKMSYDEKRKVK